MANFKKDSLYTYTPTNANAQKLMPMDNGRLS